MQPSQSEYKLSDTENHSIFIEQIEPRLLTRSLLSANPMAIFLGGQPGSGKSSLAIYYRQQFAQSGIVIVNSDALREFHPAYSTLQSTNPERASSLVDLDTKIWQRKLIESAKRARKNILLDGTLGGDVEPIKQTIQQFQQAGYVVGVSLMAVPAYQSRLGIYQRYQDQLMREGHGRWVGMGTHDSVYDQLPARIDQLEKHQLVDQVLIFARPVGNQPPELLYENQLTNGSWESKPKAGQALEAHRNRLLTYAEHKAHKAIVQDVQLQLEQSALAPEKIREFLTHVGQTAIRHRIAMANDAQLYYDWANDPDTRQQSFNSAPILWENHAAWFARKLTDPNALLLVFETTDDIPVGQVRFEKQADGEVIIGVSIDKLNRGRGLASQLIQEGCTVCRTMWGNLPISAYIKPENVASIRAFERAGFVQSHESRKFGVESVCLTRT